MRLIDRHQYIINVLRAAGDFAHGGLPEQVAVEWMAECFSPAETREWLDSRCFDAVVAWKLADSGMTPEQAARPYDAGGDTIGYAVSNMDLTIGQAWEYLKDYMIGGEQRN